MGHSRSKYKKFFRSELEICSIDSFFYPIAERNNSVLKERKDRIETNDRKPNFQCIITLFLKNKHSLQFYRY